MSEVIHAGEREALTGRTVTKIVASRDTTKEMNASDIMISHSFLVGFHSSATTMSAPFASTSTPLLLMLSGVLFNKVMADTGRELRVIASFSGKLQSSLLTVNTLICKCSPQV